MSRDDDGTTPTERDTNAEFIVRAVNSHDALLAACQAAVEDITRAGLQHTLPLTVQLIRQAIALATGNESGKE